MDQTLLMRQIQPREGIIRSPITTTPLSTTRMPRMGSTGRIPPMLPMPPMSPMPPMVQMLPIDPTVLMGSMHQTPPTAPLMGLEGLGCTL